MAEIQPQLVLIFAFEWKQINLIECLRSGYIAKRIRDLKYGPCTIMLIFTKKLPLDLRARDETEAIVTLSYRDWVYYTNKWHYEISSSENFLQTFLPSKQKKIMFTKGERLCSEIMGNFTVEIS